MKRGNQNSFSYYILFWITKTGKMKTILLTQGKVALVDDDQYEYLNQWKWYARKHRDMYYATRYDGYLNGKQKSNVQMHRVILNVSKGDIIDHKDRDGLNNQKSNLRLCTNSQNQQNKIGWGKSRFKGVCVTFTNRNNKKYRSIFAYINLNKKTKRLGSFKTEELAAIAYNNAAIELFGEFANLNIL